ncbi:MAG: hypothetical protein IKC84_01650 [Helicobacteraceae bacterium]|nr:hypothetical protein [Helicobacteraceae bacterium]
MIFRIFSSKNELFLTLIFLVFCIFAMFDLYNQNALKYIEDSFSFALTNIGVVAVLKIISGALPLTDGISDILDKIFNFFFLANILIGIQYILLIVNKILFIKILIILFFAFRFMPQFKSIATKILIILLFFNPGLNLYIGAIKIISNEANMTIDNDLNEKINHIKGILGISPKVEIEIEELGDARGTLSKVIGEIGIFGQNIQATAKDVANTITNPIDSTQKTLDEAKTKILKSMQVIGDGLSVILSLSIKYILNVFFLYFLMPILYFYIMYRVINYKPLYHKEIIHKIESRPSI